MCGESRTHGVNGGKIWRLYQRVTYPYYFEAAGIEKGVADGITLTVHSYGKDTSVAKKLQYENPELYANLAERSETITALNIYY